MRIRTRVKISGALTICVLLAYGAVVLHLDRSLSNLAEEVREANEIVNKITILRSLTQDYLLYHTERARRQWSAVYAEVLRLLHNPEYRVLQGESGIGDAPQKLKVMGDTFSRLMTSRPPASSANPVGEADRELQNRLTTQLLLATQDLTTRFFTLTEEINRKFLKTQRLSSTMDILALCVLGIMLISNAVFLRRAVVKPILQLHAGAERIGAGNLDHKVGSVRRDEIGELSRAFDRMTANLQQVTVSRDDLTREVEVRQQAENALRERGEERELAIKVLGLVNAPTSLSELTHEVTQLLQEWSGCEAVGLRLRQGEDFPYFETRGFPAAFVKLENSLCAKDRTGKLLRDRAGNPVIECMCGNVVCGRFKPELPFFTPRGSFWTNSTTQLLAATTDQDRQAHTRNRCHGEGYESVALVPLRSGQETLGLLQFNDRNQGKFTPEKIRLFEQLGDNLASGIARRQAEAEISRLASFPQMNPSPVLETDLAGAITYYNQAALEAIAKLGPGAELGELIPGDLGEIIAAVRENPEKIFYRELRIKDRVFAKNIYFAEPLQVMRIYSLDITERKRAEEKLQLTLEELERSNRDLEQFAYISSHDMQEPLRKIANFSEMLAQQYRNQLDERAVRYFGYVTDGAKRMQALINDLLSYSRVGRAEFQLIPASLDDILRGTLDELHTLIKENHAEISHDALPTLKVNPHQMGQLLQNLLTNAIKFRNEHPPRIHLSARPEGKEWLVAIRDEGIGFDPRYAENIFQVFKRLHAKEQYPGTGIGLAICKKIVERHGGRIWAESEPGRGATFYFTIPA